MKRFGKRLGVAVALLVLIGACTGGIIYFRTARPIGTGPAGPAVSKEVFATQWSTRPTLLIGLGDSVTAGFGARRGYSYFDRLIKNPEDEFADMREIALSNVFPVLSWTNLSVSGSTSLQHERSQIPKLPPAPTNTFVIVVMTTGGNDLIHNYGKTPPQEGAMYGASWQQAQPWISNFETRLDSMLRQINAVYSNGCAIFLADIYDPTDGVGDIQRAGLPKWPDGLKILEAYNQIIHAAPARHPNVHVVEMRKAFLGHGIHCVDFWSKHYDRNDPHYWYYINLEDPNKRGYDAIRRLFLNRMADVKSSLIN
jgi:hypothetical protein